MVTKASLKVGYFGGRTLANHKSAAKRARQSLKKGSRNSGTRKTVRTIEKALRVSIEKKDKKAAGELLKDYVSRIDKAAQKGILHRNHASRRVGNLSAQVTSL